MYTNTFFFSFFQQSLAFSKQKHLISNTCYEFFKIPFEIQSQMMTNAFLAGFFCFVCFFSLPVSQCMPLTQWVRSQGQGFTEKVNCRSTISQLLLPLRQPGQAEGKPISARSYQVFMLWHRYTHFMWTFHGPKWTWWRLNYWFHHYLRNYSDANLSHPGFLSFLHTLHLIQLLLGTTKGKGRHLLIFTKALYGPAAASLLNP